MLWISLRGYSPVCVGFRFMSASTARGGRAKRWLLIVVGALLAALGAASAVAIGPDNVLSSPGKSVALGPAGSLVTAPDLIAVTGSTATITAQGEGGKPVFLGVAHPVDVQDALRAREVTELTGIRGLGDITTRTRHATDKDAKGVADPAKLPIWTVKDSGTGTRSVTFPLDGAAHSVAVIGAAGSSATLTAGVALAGSFWIALAVALLGLALVVLGVRSGRRSRGDSGPGMPQPASHDNPTESHGRAPVGQAPTGDADADRHNINARTARTLTTIAPQRFSTRVKRNLTALTVLAIIPATTTGCGIPQASAVPSLERTALTAEQAKAMWADYDKRNNAAMKAQFTNVEAWATADRGLILEQDRFATALAKAEGKTGDKAQSAPYTHVSTGVYPSVFSSYPMTAITKNQEAEAKKEGYSTLTVMRRDHAGSPWLMSAAVSVNDTDLPKPAASATALTDAQIKQVSAVAEAMRSSLKTGKAVGSNPALKAADDDRKFCTDIGSTCELIVNAEYAEGEEKPVVNGAGSVAAVPVQGGVLAIANYRVVTIANSTDPARTYIYGKTYTKLYGEYSTTQLMWTYAVTAAVLIPASAPAKLLNEDTSLLLVPGVPLASQRQRS